MELLHGDSGQRKVHPLLNVPVAALVTRLAGLPPACRHAGSSAPADAPLLRTAVWRGAIRRRLSFRFQLPVLVDRNELPPRSLLSLTRSFRFRDENGAKNIGPGFFLFAGTQ